MTPDAGPPGAGPPEASRRDLRTTLLGAAAWAGSLAGLHARGVLLVVLVTASTATAVVVARRGARTFAALLLTGAALAAAAGARVEAAEGSAVAGWARERAVAETVLVIRSDPVLRHGRFGDLVVVEARTRHVAARGQSLETSVPVLVLAGAGWRDVALGSVVQVRGRLSPADSAEHAAVLHGGEEPRLLHRPGPAYRAADGVRASVREAAVGPRPAADLVPALVTGDDEALGEELVEDFRTAGLTHLTAVSGTNLTLVLGSLLLLSRLCGVRGRGFLLVGLLGIAGFVLLARPEPSVVRAAAMGTVALLGLTAGGRASGVRALGAAVLLLLVHDPWLAASPGFILSVLATAGILFVAPAVRDALARWMPRWLAEAVAVPVAAQLACTPVVAALSGEVSLVAVAANLVVAPAVGPATVLGLAGGLAGLVLPPFGAALGWLATWSAQVVVTTAQVAAGLPTAAIGWPTGAAGLTALTVLTVLLTLAAPALLRRRGVALVLAAVLVAVVLRPLPAPGWPPRGWLLVMCDVGQGDAVAVRTGPGTALVVDAGPDPRRVDRCLDRLGVRRVPAVVLTHFHADHVDGLPGVLDGRAVAEVQVSASPEPAYGAEQVRRWTAAAHVPVRVPAYGESAVTGEVGWQVLGPRRPVAGNPNDSSLVVLLRTRGVDVLLTGDVEPGGQAALLRERTGPVDVLKVPHHGSRHQDPRLLEETAPRVALVSVGEGNEYGHPDPGLLEALGRAGALVARTDRDGDVAVVLRDGRLGLVGAR